MLGMNVIKRTFGPLVSTIAANGALSNRSRNAVTRNALTHINASACKPAVRSFSCWNLGSLRSALPGRSSAGASTGSKTVPLPARMQQPHAIIQRGMANQRHKKMIKLAKGYRNRANCYSVAVQRVHKARQYAYRDRKVKKRDFRSLWIQRINAGVRQYNYFPYSVFMNRLKTHDVRLNRKVLADMAISEPLSFRSVVEVANTKA